MVNPLHQKKIERIDTLTSLRFFAVTLIVLHHSVGHFGISREGLGPFAFDHAVSYFFILSGFVMVYVYGDLQGRDTCQRFFIARFARLWPAHVLTGLFFLFVILPAHGFIFNKHNILITFSNLFMFHSWIPILDYFFSLNPPSWCVSTEFFFYLIFPFAIFKWQKTWIIKITISLIILFLMVKLTEILNLPAAGKFNSKACIEGMVYINPLSRTFEFLLGMIICLFWKKNIAIRRLGYYAGTIIEVIVLSLCVLSIYYTQSLVIQVWAIIGSVWATWLYHTFSAPAIALLIFFMALQKGLISKILNLRLLVILGEMSYSVFLIHHIIIYLYHMHIECKLPAQRMEDYVIYWIVLLISSYLFWKYVEEPLRRLILRFADSKMSIKALPLTSNI